MAIDPERAFESTAGDEDATHPPRPCVVCADETPLRCARCGEPVCERHEACPNGCDDPPAAAPMHAVADVARRLRARLRPPENE